MVITLRKNAKHQRVELQKNIETGEFSIDIPAYALTGINCRSMSQKNSRRIINSFAYKKAIRQILAAAEYDRECGKIRDMICNGYRFLQPAAYTRKSMIGAFYFCIPLKEISRPG